MTVHDVDLFTSDGTRWGLTCRTCGYERDGYQRQSTADYAAEQHALVADEDTS